MQELSSRSPGPYAMIFIGECTSPNQGRGFFYPVSKNFMGNNRHLLECITKFYGSKTAMGLGYMTEPPSLLNIPSFPDFNPGFSHSTESSEGKSKTSKKLRYTYRKQQEPVAAVAAVATGATGAAGAAGGGFPESFVFGKTASGITSPRGNESKEFQIFRKAGEKVLLVHPTRFRSRFSMIKPFYTKDSKKYYGYLAEFRLQLTRFVDAALNKVLNDNIQNILEDIKASDNRFDNFHLALSEIMASWCQEKKNAIKVRWDLWIDEMMDGGADVLDYLFMPLPSQRFRSIVMTRLCEFIYHEIRKAPLNEYIGSGIFINDLSKHGAKEDLCVENCANQRASLKKCIDTCENMLNVLQENFPLEEAADHLQACKSAN